MLIVMLVLGLLVSLLFAFSLFVLLRNKSGAAAAADLAKRLKRRFFPTPLSKQETRYSRNVVPEGEEPGRAPGHTLLLPLLLVEQLDPKSMKPVKRFQVRDIPEYGVSVSRPDSAHGDIILADFSEEAFTVSEDHARILRDEDGFFLQDSGSRNLVYVKGSRTPVDEVSIEDGLVVFLGMQPLRFFFPDPFSTGTPDPDGETRTRPQRSDDPDDAAPVTYRRAPRRRHPAQHPARE